MMVRFVMFSAIFLAVASVPAAAETGDDAGRLVIGQGANSCWAWTRSHRSRGAMPNSSSCRLAAILPRYPDRIFSEFPQAI